MDNMRYLNIILLSIILTFSIKSQVIINEFSASNLESFPDNFNKYEDWIELYNISENEVDIGGYYLSDKEDKPLKYQIPQGISIPAHGFKVFWTSGRDTVMGSHIHTNFKLAQAKNNPEFVILSNPFGNLIEKYEILKTQFEHSRGRKSDGAGIVVVFTEPTPGSTNSNATNFKRYAEDVDMSLEPGFYSGEIKVAMRTDEPNSIIRYTTDGIRPNINSSVYNDTLTFTKTVSLQARAFTEDPLVLPGYIEFNTFFIDEAHDLPVISVISDDIELLLAGDKSYFPKGSLEFFDETGDRVASSFGEYNSHGQDSWAHNQRSIDYITRDESGYKHHLKDKFFKNSDRKEFQRLILRAAGDDNYPGIDSSTQMRDAYTQSLAYKAGMHLDVRKVRRCVMYVNGKYWGIYSIREKVDDPDYTDYYYDQGKYDIDFLMHWGSTWVEFGDPDLIDDWNQFFNFIRNNDMEDPENYEYVADRLDVLSLTDYTLIQSASVCSDWLTWNVGWWRGLDPEGEHKKWGYIMWDQDATFNHYINYTGVPSTHWDASACYHEDLNSPWSDPNGHIRILNKLRDNEDFRQMYLSRYLDMINTYFSCDSMLAHLDTFVQTIESEIPQHTTRWGGSMQQWEQNVDKLRNFISLRCAFIQQGWIDCQNLGDLQELTLSVVPEGKGIINLNTISVDQFPWSGEYVEGLDILLGAESLDTNYVFDHWEAESHAFFPDDTTKQVTLSLTSADHIIAHFKPLVTKTKDPVQNDFDVSFAPMPFSDQTTFSYYSSELISGCQLLIFDALGKQIRRMDVQHGKPSTIHRKLMESGIYTYRLEGTEGSLIYSGKIIVQ
jgi:hypothetical protein